MPLLNRSQLSSVARPEGFAQMGPDGPPSGGGRLPEPTTLGPKVVAEMGGPQPHIYHT